MVKNIFIIGTDYKWEEAEILKSAQMQKIEAAFLDITKIQLRVNHNEAEVFFNGEDITTKFKQSRLVFRRTRGRQGQMIALALLADSWQIPFTDSVVSILSNLNKMIALPAIHLKKLKHIPTVFCEELSKREENSLSFDFPVLVKPALGRHGEGIEILENQDAWQKVLGKRVLLQPFLSFEAEYRVFVLKNEVLGVIKKIPETGKKIANYAAGAQFLVTELPNEIKSEAIEVCQQQQIEIAGVDLAQSGEDFYLLEVNRCPEFFAFTNATKVNVAEKILNFILSKK